MHDKKKKGVKSHPLPAFKQFKVDEAVITIKKFYVDEVICLPVTTTEMRGTLRMTVAAMNAIITAIIAAINAIPL